MLKVLPTTKHYNAGRRQRNGAQGQSTTTYLKPKTTKS